jgi:hypothetical protein
MAKGNFPPALADELVYEGGYTADRRDPGHSAAACGVNSYAAKRNVGGDGRGVPI